MQSSNESGLWSLELQRRFGIVQQQPLLLGVFDQTSNVRLFLHKPIVDLVEELGLFVDIVNRVKAI